MSKKKLFAIILSLVMVLSLIPGVTFAAEGQEPAHAKLRQDNGDGTYTLALSVTGDSEKKVTKVNVVVVLDTSGSMDENTGNVTTTYIEVSADVVDWYGTVYGLDADGNYVQLGEEWNWDDWSIHYSLPNGTAYTGPFYRRGNTESETRLQAAEKAVNSLATKLLANNTKEGNDPDTVEMALVTFATTAAAPKGPATDATTFAGYMNGLNANGGTNWEAGLTAAQNVDFAGNSTDDEANQKTYVIFVSDGNPTFRTSQFNGSWDDYNGRYGVYGSGQEQTQNISRSFDAAKAAADAMQENASFDLYTIGVYGNVDRMQGLGGDGYYAASDTDALNTALDEILAKIEEAGIGNVEIGDGTTSNVTTESGPLHLLSVDGASFRYYRAGGTNADGTVKYDPSANKITADVADSEGNITKQEVEIGVEWKASDDPAPPAATLDENGKVVWDLSSLEILENGVTYTVTFKCAPGQDALDMIADLKNGKAYNDVVPEEAREYLDANGNLKTNTEGTLKYTDTRTGVTKTIEYTNPPAVPTKAEQIDITKIWQGTYWNQELNDGKGGYENEQPITLELHRDGTKVGDITLDPDEDFTKSTYIAIGVMTVDENAKKVQVLTDGHDYQLKEVGEVSYHWEFKADVMHPMNINGTTTMLVLVEEVPEGVSGDFAIVDGTKYYKIGDNYYTPSTTSNALTATNIRRSTLNLIKAVSGENVPEDAAFTYSVKITLAKNVTDANEKDLYYSLYVPKAKAADYADFPGVTDDEGGKYLEFKNSGEKEMKDGEWTGYYHASCESAITVTIPANVNLRFVNMLTGTEFEMVETDVPENFECVDIVIEPEEKEGTPEELLPTISVEDATITGTIVQGETHYQVTYTNDYLLGSLKITKTIEGLPEGEAPEALAFEVTGPKDYSKTVKYSDFEDGEYLITELPIGEYTVKETGAEYEGYTLDPDTVDTVTAKVEKGKEATAEFTNVYEEIVIEPVYGDPPVQKILEGDKPAKDSTFEFALTAKSYEGDGKVEKLPMPDEASFEAQKKVVKITGEGTEEFGKLEFTVPGTYTYTITEEKGSEEGYTYDETVHTVVYKVTENEDGTLGCVKTVDGGDPIDGMENDEANISKFSFTNKYTKPVVSVKVTKVWKDGDNAEETRPESVNIKLLANGEDAKKYIVLSENTEWTAAFEGLDKYDANGKEIVYTVEEEEVKGYTAKVTGTAAEGFTVTNTLETPDTGDHSDIALWTSTMCASLLGIALLAVIKRRKPAKHSR